LKLDSHALNQHLKGDLHGIYFLHGAEDLLLIESLDKLRAKAFKNEFRKNHALLYVVVLTGTKYLVT